MKGYINISLFDTNYILNPDAKKAMQDLNQDYDNFLDKYLLINSVYRDMNGGVKSNDYSAFGIAANTPGMSLAEAQILANADEIIKKL